MCERCQELEAQVAAMRAALIENDASDYCKVGCSPNETACIDNGCERWRAWKMRRDALAADAGREWLEAAREVTAALRAARYMIFSGERASAAQDHMINAALAKAEALGLMPKGEGHV